MFWTVEGIGPKAVSTVCRAAEMAIRGALMSVNQPATVDVDGGTGHPAGLVAGQERDGVGNVGRAADTSERRTVKEELHGLLVLQHGLGERGLDEARGNSID